MEAREDRSAFWRELHEAARQLNAVTTKTAEEMRKLPQGSELATEMLEIVERLDRLVAGGEKACREIRVPELQELLDLKSSALRITVHELRRPLSLINGYLSMLQSPALNPVPKPIAQIAGQVRAGVQDIARLIASLEETARLEDRAQALQWSSCDLYRLAEEAILAVRSEAAAKGTGVYLQAPPSGSGAIIEADPDRLRTAIVNLLDNAIKFSPSRSQVIVVTSTTAEAATIAVSDEGPGLHAADLEDLFHPWRRGRDVGADGLGLGLYIVRQVVELHGGEVKVESTPSHGATFTLWLPR